MNHVVPMKDSLIDICFNFTDDFFRSNEESFIKKAKEVGVSHFIVIGNDLKSSQLALQLANKYKDSCYTSAGYHPHNAKLWNDESYKQLKEIAQESKCKAIGECGLDFYRDFSPRDKQIEAFHQHISLAAETSLPIFIHERGSFQDMIAILKERRQELSRAVVHCFTGQKEELEAYLALDMYIGLTGWICDEKRGTHLREFINIIPNDRLMVETDAPYLSPFITSTDPSITEDQRHNNRPEYLPTVVEQIAKSRDQSYNEICSYTTTNARTFFGI